MEWVIALLVLWCAVTLHSIYLQVKAMRQTLDAFWAEHIKRNYP